MSSYVWGGGALQLGFDFHPTLAGGKPVRERDCVATLATRSAEAPARTTAGGVQKKQHKTPDIIFSDEISAESRDVLCHVARPSCCHIPSLAANGSSAPVWVWVWERAVVFPAFCLFTRQALWLRVPAEAIEWNSVYICSTHCRCSLNIDSVQLLLLYDLRAHDIRIIFAFLIAADAEFQT